MGEMGAFRAADSVGVVGALESEREDQNWFCNSICLAARNLGITEWKGIVGAVAGFLWIGDLFEGTLWS
jgi:hypothetical protein